MGMRAIWAFATVPASKKIKKNLRPLGRGGVTRPNLGRIPRDTYVQICTPPYTYKHVGTRMYTYVRERTHMYSYVRARTHTYSYVHARTRTYTYVRVPWDSPQLGTPPTRGSEFFFFCWLAGWWSSLAWMAVLAGRPCLAMPLLSGVSVKLLDC